MASRQTINLMFFKKSYKFIKVDIKSRIEKYRNHRFCKKCIKEHSKIAIDTIRYHIYHYDAYKDIRE